jgi:predicted RNase H-like nuclease
VERLLAGVDGCSGGWVVALADEDFTNYTLRQIASVGDLFSDRNAPSVVAVDTPIGLPKRSGPKGRTPERLLRPIFGNGNRGSFPFCHDQVC